MNKIKNSILRPAHIAGICAVLLMFTGCASNPVQPMPGTNQTLTQDGQIQSHEGNYVVRISKMVTRSADYKNIAKYGLPVRVTVVNLSNKALAFGPEHVQLLKNGQHVSALTADKFMDIRRKKDRNDAIWAGVMGTLAVGVSVLGALSGDAALAQSSQQQSADALNTAFESYSQSTQYTADTMNALSHQVSSSVLNSAMLKPKEVVDGIVFFEKVKTTEPITIVVQTAEMKHEVVFKK